VALPFRCRILRCNHFGAPLPYPSPYGSPEVGVAFYQRIFETCTASPGLSPWTHVLSCTHGRSHVEGTATRLGGCLRPRAPGRGRGRNTQRASRAAYLADRRRQHRGARARRCPIERPALAAEGLMPRAEQEEVLGRGRGQELPRLQPPLAHPRRSGDELPPPYLCTAYGEDAGGQEAGRCVPPGWRDRGQRETPAA